MLLLKDFKRLKASSIVESVMAITIISVCALVAFTIYLNVIGRTKSTNYFNAKQSVNLLVQESIEQNDYENNNYAFKGFTINKKVDINTTDHTAQLIFSFTLKNKTHIINRLITYHEPSTP